MRRTRLQNLTMITICTVLLVSTLIALTEVALPQGQPPPSSESTTKVAPTPPEDPLFPQDISAWTYTPEFAERFKRMKLKEPGPTGAYAVNFQVHQVEELDRCMFNVFLDNTLPIDYPEGPVGFLSFTYPMSWAFLKLSPEDQQAVEAAYLGQVSGATSVSQPWFRRGAADLFSEQGELSIKAVAVADAHGAV